jgi:hypothetical protein
MEIKKLFLFMVVLMTVYKAYSQIKTGDSIYIREKIPHDQYVAGGTVTIDAPVHGDLIVTGGTVNLNDTITQDLMAAGGNITVKGYVGDDIRCVGGSIILSNTIAGDVVVTGGTIYIGKGAVINGNLLVSGGKITIDGEVKGFIRNVSGSFYLNGKARNNIDCSGGKIIINGTVDGNSILAANTIEIGNDARFNKDVAYWNNDEKPDFKSSLNHVKASYDPSLQLDNGKWHFLGFASVLMALWYLGMALLIIVLIQYLFSNAFKKAAMTVKNKPQRSLGMGFLFLIGVPLLILVSMISIIGIPIAVLMLIGYSIIIMSGTIIISILAANWINNTKYQSLWSNKKIIFSAFAIFILLKIILSTPVIGPISMALLVAMALGGLLQNVRWKRNQNTALN